MRRNSWFVILVLVYHAVFCLSANKTTDEHRLFNKLMANCNPATRPVLNASDAVNVKVFVSLVQILSMDAESQVLNTIMWLSQDWKDECLHWDPDDFDGLKEFRIPSDKIWLPDLVLVNSADNFKNDKMQGNAIVESNGNVNWVQPLKLRSSCAMNIQDFPFDVQECVLKFSSWTYYGDQINLTLIMDGVDDISKYYFSNTEWKLLKFKAKRNVIKYSCCEEEYHVISVQITIQRMPLYYFYNIIIPCVWLTILNLLVFLLPPEGGDKISLGVTIFLAFSVFMLVIAGKVPVTSQSVPLIGFYLTVAMGMTSLSLIMTVFTLKLRHIGPHRRGVPRWLQLLSHDVLSRILCLKPTVYPFHREYKNIAPEQPESGIADNNQTKDSVDKLLGIWIEKQEAEERQQNIVEEWRFVASVFDRLLFWLFLIGIVVYSALVLHRPTTE